MGRALGVEELELAAHRRRGRVRVDQPGVREARGPAHRGVGVRRDPDRRARVGDGAHRQPHPVEPGPRQVPRHRPTAPELVDDGEVLGEPPHLLLGRDTERGVLLGAVPEAHREHRPAPADDVEARVGLRRVHRVVHGQQVAAGADDHLPRLGREPGEPGQRLDVGEGPGEVVLAGEDRVEALVPRPPDQVELLVEDDDGVLLGTALVGEVEPDADRRLSHAGAAIRRNRPRSVTTARYRVNLALRGPGRRSRLEDLRVSRRRMRTRRRGTDGTGATR